MTASLFDQAQGVIVIADDDVARAAAQAAVTGAAMRLVATAGWSDAYDRVSVQAAPAMLMLETAGVADGVVERALPALIDAVGAARTIVTIAVDQLDRVGAALIGGEAALLCDPAPAERVAALILTAHADALDIRDSRDEVARLAQINAEVARFTETLARLTGASQGVRAAAGRDPLVGDRRPVFGQQPVDEAPATAVELRGAIRARRLRDEIFGLPGLFEDPAWDMLLDLFAAELERRDVSVSSLCIAASVAPKTALRWINKLIEVGLFVRQPDVFDRRRAFVALTPRASSALRDYVAAVRRAGLAIA